jgi:hypothetical protein
MSLSLSLPLCLCLCLYLSCCGGQINAVNGDEDTPLHGVAFASIESPDLAQFLVDAGELCSCTWCAF